LYYHGARYYAPWLGRWVSCDPLGTVDGPNLFSYVQENPICFIDIKGTQRGSEWIKKLRPGFRQEYEQYVIAYEKKYGEPCPVSKNQYNEFQIELERRAQASHRLPEPTTTLSEMPPEFSPMHPVPEREYQELIQAALDTQTSITQGNILQSNFAWKAMEQDRPIKEQAAAGHLGELLLAGIPSQGNVNRSQVSTRRSSGTQRRVAQIKRNRNLRNSQHRTQKKDRRPRNFSGDYTFEDISRHDYIMNEKIIKASDEVQMRLATISLKQALTENPILKYNFSPQELAALEEAFGKNLDPNVIHSYEIKGFTWHHFADDPRVLMLVDRAKHQRFQHYGGRAATQTKRY
jgi:hypothetical protein